MAWALIAWGACPFVDLESRDMERRETQQCNYEGPSGHRCENDAGEGDLCFWHDPEAPKDGPHVREELEAYAKSGRSMEGFRLRRADLHGIDLVNRSGNGGYDMSHADLRNANLSGAHLFALDLHGSLLLKADMSRASLNQANLQDADLLGVRLRRARVEHTRWGDKVLQERAAFDAMRDGNRTLARENFEQAEEIYRNLRKTAEGRGQFENAGSFFYHEMVMRRYQMPLWSWQRCFAKLVDVFCGYGEAPIRVICFSVLFILICSVFYFFLHINYGGDSIGYNSSLSLYDNIVAFGNCFYFSVVTFTTLGYGDISPQGWARPVAAFEAFCGSFTLALFVVVFVKKMTR